jgi:hypothetical protein
MVRIVLYEHSLCYGEQYTTPPIETSLEPTIPIYKHKTGLLGTNHRLTFNVMYQDKTLCGDSE